MTRKTGTKNKNHIEYICQNCNKNFGCQKYVYTKHINKKYPCKLKDELIENKIVNSNNYITPFSVKSGTLIFYIKNKFILLDLK